jgi:acyl dehydratase
MAMTTHPYGRKPIHYDRVHRRLWIFGQRCHHGATGMFLTFCGAVGVALMAHDWKDRSVWFARGPQED